jgi:hypothetical protein
MKSRKISQAREIARLLEGHYAAQIGISNCEHYSFLINVLVDAPL